MDVNKSGHINLDKLHSYLLRLPAVFTSRDCEALVDRIQREKTSLRGFNLFEFQKLFKQFEPLVICSSAISTISPSKSETLLLKSSRSKKSVRTIKSTTSGKKSEKNSNNA